ncbi:MAG: hypothetical protein J7K31_03690 [Candidatus Aenigmarchaeota archaeon]|nr:hypothetical protein [Candidatus Aenigmarchaeota archaeon]
MHSCVIAYFCSKEGVVLARKTKYKKTHTTVWKCKKCGFEWYYNSVRCPICSSEQKIIIN